ncbi:MAG: NTP transferase domain-containing protein [Armatimonadetes bacterium]|jgi:UTP--glucose-1-phosphate uridylyltransferase|nr:NTP transferase domain-containing protein [Armatimonadota bacterium]
MTAPHDNRLITKAVIPAAGKGTRLLPLTKAVPKELIPLGTKPVLEHIVEEVIEAGISEVLFVISEQKTAIRTHFGDGIGSVRFEYTFQTEQKGLADAISYAQDFVGCDPFAVVLGDSIIDTNQKILPFSRVLNTFAETDAAGVIVVQKTPRDEVSRYGIVKPKDGIAPSFPIDGLVEKPDPADAPSEYAIAGRYAFDPTIFDYIRRTTPGANGELQITDSVGLMLDDGAEVWCVALQDNEIRRDIGTFESYFEALQIEINKNSNPQQ